jgi:hypothetical protein
MPFMRVGISVLLFLFRALIQALVVLCCAAALADGIQYPFSAVGVAPVELLA